MTLGHGAVTHYVLSLAAGKKGTFTALDATLRAGNRLGF